jgi:hypothetical protein
MGLKIILSAGLLTNMTVLIKWYSLWWLLTGRIERANWQNSGYCVAVWSVIYPHFQPFFLPASIGHARVIQHRIKSKNGFDSVIGLFTGFWIKIIRKIIFYFECHNFFLHRNSHDFVLVTFSLIKLQNHGYSMRPLKIKFRSHEKS